MIELALEQIIVLFLFAMSGYILGKKGIVWSVCSQFFWQRDSLRNVMNRYESGSVMLADVKVSYARIKC